MPSVSGWALRPTAMKWPCPTQASFLCPHIGLGFATRLGFEYLGRHASFYALDIGLGFATHRRRVRRGLRRPNLRAEGAAGHCFYALDIGLGFATAVPFELHSGGRVTFLCPRYRAGLCDPEYYGLMAQCVSVSMPSISGWALRLFV